jgi:hypothetical protein
VLHQHVWPHVVVGADHQAAQRVHERVVSIAAVARPEEIFDQRLELLVAQPLVDVGDELLLLARPDVVQLVVRARLFQQGIVHRAGVVEDNHVYRVAVPPEVLVVELDRLADIPKSVGGNDKEQIFRMHKGNCSQGNEIDLSRARDVPDLSACRKSDMAVVEKQPGPRNLQASGGEMPVLSSAWLVQRFAIGE